MAPNPSSECKPLTSLDDLRAWEPPKYLLKVPPAPIQPRCLPVLAEQAANILNPTSDVLPLKSCSRSTLVCHDMMGGYLADKWANGVDCGPVRPYTFDHWANIDVFVYFSHHLVTIPPPGWVNAAHRNGVSVLGTIITEWDEGAKICDEILSNSDSIDWFVARCVAIAVAHGFDGYLLNIENKLERGQERGQVAAMLQLAERLTNRMRAAIGDHSKVIWYDSVTTNGDLCWQNQLSPLNRPFFEACDAIFLNYTWTPEGLDDTVKLLGDWACKERISDVFVGLDVFGRGCPGCGGFNSIDAMDVIRTAATELSVAIFAPGWTYELPHRLYEKNPIFFPLECSFLGREYAYWSLLAPHLQVRGPKLKLPLLLTENETLVFESGFRSGCCFLEKEESFAQNKPLFGRQSPGDCGGEEGESPHHQGEGNPAQEKEKESWWLDLTRQEFESSFLRFERWPEEKEEEEKAVPVEPLEAKNSGYRIYPIGKAGLRIKTEKAPIRVPIWLCDISHETDNVRLKFTMQTSVANLKLCLCVTSGDSKARVDLLPLDGQGSAEVQLQAGERVAAIGIEVSEQVEFVLKKLSIFATL